MKPNVYLYGMVVLTSSFLLKYDYPGPDSYGEITKRFQACGGETGTAAVVLANLGTRVHMDGSHLGTGTYPALHKYYKSIGVDISSMTYDKDYDGLEDFVMTAKSNRTCFGTFESYFSDPKNGRWNMPKASDIRKAKAAGIDPFFFDASLEAAKLCNDYGVKYVTIDCKYDNPMHHLSEVNVVSNEYLHQQYEGENHERLFKKYTETSSGLVIFTYGANELIYGRKGQKVKRFKPFDLEVVSTLGAGDSFKAGAVYALSQGMDDDALVAFASATAGCALTHYPIVEGPPTLEKVNAILHSRA